MLKGIFPVLPTCFNTNGDLDVEAQKQVIQFAVAAGAHGIVFPGVASEYNYLSERERGELIRLLVEEVQERIPIVAGVSAAEPETVISLGQEAVKNGIRQLMVMAPNHLGHNVAGHQSFLRAIAEALPDCELILQNAPVPIGAGLQADQLLEIVRPNSAITYLKEETLPSGPTITALLKEHIPHLAGVFGGGGARYIVDELNRGALGAVPAVEITDLHVALYRAHEEGDHTKLRALYRLSLPLLTAQKIYRMSLTKYVLWKRGVADARYVRAPSLELDAHTRKDIDQMLKDLKEANVFTWKA